MVPLQLLDFSVLQCTLKLKKIERSDITFQKKFTEGGHNIVPLSYDN